MIHEYPMLAYHKHQFVSMDRTLEIYFSGCHNNCKGCHNAELKIRNNKTCKWITPVELSNELYDYIGIAKQVHILGGEPLEQDIEALDKFLEIIHFMGFKNIILFTGFVIDKQDINKNVSPFRYVDYVKTGPYDETKLNKYKDKDKLTGIILASTNQKIYKVM